MSAKVWRINGTTLRKFRKSRAPVRIIQGPVRSGTSTVCTLHIPELTREMKPGADCWRRSRWYVVRQTYDQLRRSTVKTWQHVFPENQYGDMKMTPPFEHRLVDEANRLDTEMIFLALEGDQDIARLMSAEVTGMWFNELQFFDKGIFDEAFSRTGFGPNKERHTGSGWYGIIADMNAPTEDHWVPRMRGDVPLPDDMTEEEKAEFEKPDHYEFYVQPPGLLETFDERGKVTGYESNPEAENLEFIGHDYYLQQAKGKPRAWVDSRIMNRVLLRVDGKPVWPSFRPEFHVAKEILKPIEGAPVIVGLDFARNPAAVFAQNVRGKWLILREMVAENVSSVIFAPAVKAELARHFPGHDVLLWGDPTGDSRTGTSDVTQFQVFQNAGLRVIRAPGWNDFEMRRQAVDGSVPTLGVRGRARSPRRSAARGRA